MVSFTARILKFKQKGEKTGWTYIDIPQDIAQKLKPNNKRSFRVKGKLDAYEIKGIALVPMGDGNFIMALNSIIRKGIMKKEGAMLQVAIALDKEEYQLDADLVVCLEDEPLAFENFKSLLKSHQNYFSKWIQTAKTNDTKAKRIAQTVTAMLKKQSFPEMIRANKIVK